MQKTISKWGNSLATRIPDSLVDQLGISDGTKAEITSDGKSILITPVREEESLEQLVSKITMDNLHSEKSGGFSIGNEF